MNYINEWNQPPGAPYEEVPVFPTFSKIERIRFSKSGVTNWPAKPDPDVPEPGVPYEGVPLEYPPLLPLYPAEFPPW